ncbi:MAG: response regulator [Xanthobacteraceae bacterium]
MTGDLVSVRVLAISGSAAERELWRRAAGQIAVPIDIIEVENAAAACKALALSVQDIDVAFLDSELADKAAFIEAAQAARQRPFVILVGAANGAPAAPGIDGGVSKPATLDQAKAMIGRCVRVRLPSRVLVVDDSATMRSIVRKLLSATRFRLEIAEAEDGIQALKQIGVGRFDLVVLDYNMPGLNGVETLSEIKRQYPRVGVVIMSSAQDEGVAERARAAGAAAFLKKPFYASDIDAVLHSVYGLQTASPPGA